MKKKLPEHLFIGPVEHTLLPAEPCETLEGIDIELDSIQGEFYEILDTLYSDSPENDFEFKASKTGTNFLNFLSNSLDTFLEVYKRIINERPNYFDTDILYFTPKSAYEFLLEFEKNKIEISLESEFLNNFPFLIRDSLELFRRIMVFIEASENKKDNGSNERIIKIYENFSNLQTYFVRKLFFRISEKALKLIITSDTELQEPYIEQYRDYLIYFFTDNQFDLSLSTREFREILNNKDIGRFFLLRCLEHDFVKPFTDKRNLFAFSNNYLTLFYKKRKAMVMKQGAAGNSVDSADYLNNLHESYMDLLYALECFLNTSVNIVRRSNE